MDDLVLRTERLPGLVATDVIETNGNASWVFPAAGAVLRRLAAVSVPAGTLPGAGPVIVHGDYGPQNLLVDPDRRIVTGVLDAEWSKHAPAGLQHADAAWFEWVIRYHHPRLTALLAAFHEGYGEVPPWSLRQQLMLLRCGEILDFAARRDGKDGGSARLWRERLAATRAFTG